MEFKWTEDISSEVYKNAFYIRKTVFVEEQNVPAELEVDDLETKTLHVVGYNNGEPSVAARIYEKEPHIYKVQRVAVLKKFRRLGKGIELMKAIEDYAKTLGARKLKLDSQDHAIPFYEKIGFKTQGEGFMDAGIPHHTMIKELMSSP